MKRVKEGYRIVLVLVLGIVLFASNAAAMSQGGGHSMNDKKWIFSIRGGPSFFSKKSAAGVSAPVGSVLNSSLAYKLSDTVVMGASIDWESHDLEAPTSSLTLGRASTISIIPFVEIRPPHAGQIAPYGSFGAGANFNTIAEDGALNNVCIGSCSFDSDITVAIRIGAGIDYLVTPAISFNTELSWKLNSGALDPEGNFGALVPPTRLNASALSVLLGLRYNF